MTDHGTLLSLGIYCTPSYYRGPVWADMNSLHAGSPMMQCKVVMPKSSLSSSEEIGDSLDGNTCKKPRTQFTPKQLMYLEDKFAEERFPTLKDREDMAKELDLTQMHIQVRYLDVTSLRYSNYHRDVIPSACIQIYWDRPITSVALSAPENHSNLETWFRNL